jgi:DNA-binding NarL/FixJ family response regulator
MHKSRLLLVDDHALVRAGIRNALAGVASLEVVGELGDAAQLHSAIAELQPDCLLIDVTMPDFEPIGAIEAIRRRYPALKILVVSAHDDDFYVQGLLRAGVNGYHLKDQSLHDLQEAVQHVLQGERWVTGRLLDKLFAATSERPATPQLTKRQRGILALLEAGYDNQRIASQIGISVKTVENHLTRLYRQLGVQSRLEAVNIGRKHPQLAESSQALSTYSLPLHNQQTHILIVDDNERFRGQLRRQIGRFAPHATISEAPNTTVALQALRRQLPHLIFVDVVLGNEDGIDCTRQLCRAAPKTRVILITAYPDREFRRRGMAAGAIALLDKKNLDGAALREIVRDVM